MASYTLSISRWHKVAERLSRAYTQLTQNARNTFISTKVGGYLGEPQIARLRELAQSEVEHLFQAFEIQDSLIQLRQAIGDTNARTGVSTLLAEYDALLRRHKLLDTILNSQASNMVSLNELAMLPSQVMTDGFYERSRSSVVVKVLDAETEARFSQEAETLLAKVYALADQISDLNRERLTFEVSDAIAKVAGL